VAKNILPDGTIYQFKILPNGTLEMYDPSAALGSKYQYKRIGGVPCRRILPDHAKWMPIPAWELDVLGFDENNPVSHYFLNN